MFRFVGEIVDIYDLTFSHSVAVNVVFVLVLMLIRD